MRIRKYISEKLFNLSIMWFGLLSLATHIWTVVLTYKKYSFDLAIISLISPILSELFWFLKKLFSDGLFSAYCLMLLATLAFGGLCFLAEKIDPSANHSLHDAGE